MKNIRFITDSHKFHRLEPTLTEQIIKAQDSVFENEFINAESLIRQSLNDLKISVSVPMSVAQLKACEISDQPYGKLVSEVWQLLKNGGVAEQSLRILSESVATRIQLLRAFTDPDLAVRTIRDKVISVIQDFPSEGRNLEVGRNKGDVLDPFILAANQILLWEGSFEDAIGATVSHKALMIIEGLMGHLHEDVLGMMRGNVRVPEPRGKDQEALDYEANPFPGADLMQPPLFDGDTPKFHQIKSKTGSAKGGDGKRLGDQLSQLQTLYGGDIYYHALVGNTLVGHRSKAGVEKAAPSVVVQVGEASFETLTGSIIGPHLLLRLYEEAFKEAAKRTGYSIPTVLDNIVEHFRNEAETHGEDFLHTILENATQGPKEMLDNRLFNERRKAKKKTSKRSNRTI